MNVEVTKISKDKPVVVKPKQKRKTAPRRYSNFFITVNSQINMFNKPAEEHDRLLKEFDEVCYEFYENDAFQQFVKHNNVKTAAKYGLSTEASREELIKRVIDCKVKYTVEIGQESGKLHSHAMVSICKRLLDNKFDYTGVQKWFREKLAERKVIGKDKAVHVTFQLYKDAKRNLETYIAKAPVT